MNSNDVILRLRAFHAGHPLSRGTTKRTFVADNEDVLIVSFVKMGGESRPWGIAFGKAGTVPKVVVVPEARNRDLVAEMAVKFAPVLLRHLRHPSQGNPILDNWEYLKPIRQLWLPNESHLDMLHHLAYAYARTSYGGAHREMLNALGRACGWLFREAQRPGQMSVAVATQVLREAFTFPTENIRQSHLGYLLAWLETRGNYEKRLAAATDAEQRSTSTSLDPELERRDLEPQVEQWGEANKSGSKGQQSSAAKAIEVVLRRELEHRWQLTERALQFFRNDRRRDNSGLAQLVDESLREQWFQYTRLERRIDDEEDGPAFFPPVETDNHPAAAASRYLVYQASAELVESLLVHDDKELLVEAIANGDAFQGEIIHVFDDRIGRTTRPVWKIVDTAERQLRLRLGSRVAAVGFKERTGVIRAIDKRDDGSFVIEVEITGRKTDRNPGPGIHAYSPIEPRRLLRHETAFVSAPADAISRRKSQRIWQNDGPGAWLTHCKPGARHAVTLEGEPDDVATSEE